MRILVFCVFFGLLFSISPAWGQPCEMLKEGEELAPQKNPPVFLRATATEVKGEVAVWLSRPVIRWTVKRNAQIPETGYTYPVSGAVLVWAADKRPLTLGKEVKAYSQSGKPLSKEAVLKALSKQATVVCFERATDDLEPPDPFYTAMFRDDTILLMLRVCLPTR